MERNYLIEVTPLMIGHTADRSWPVRFLSQCLFHKPPPFLFSQCMSLRPQEELGPGLACLILGASWQELLLHSPNLAHNGSLHILIYLPSTWFESVYPYLMYLPYSPTTLHSHQSGVHVWALPPSAFANIPAGGNLTSDLDFTSGCV